LRSGAASGRRKRCGAAFSAYCRSRRRIIERASTLEGDSGHTRLCRTRLTVRFWEGFRMPEWLFDLFGWISAKRIAFNILARSRLCWVPARIRTSASDRRRVDRPMRRAAPGDLVPGSGDRSGGSGLTGHRSVRSAVRQRPYRSNQLPDRRRTRSSISPQGQRQPPQRHTAQTSCGRLCSYAHRAAR